MSHSTEIDNSKEWVRCQLAIQLVVRPSLLSVLHNDNKDSNYAGLPRHNKSLYDEIEKIKNKLKPKDKNVLNSDQWNIALPNDGSRETDSTKFDPTIIRFFIIHGKTLPRPSGGWVKPNPPTSNDVKAYAVCKAIEKRNELAHPTSLHIPKDEFDTLWFTLEEIVTNLGCWEEHKDLMGRLKDQPLEDHKETQLEIFKQALINRPNRDEVQKMIKKEIGKLKSTDSLVLDSVLSIICKEFDDWKSLATRLEVSDEDIQNIASDEELNDQDRMSKIFDKMNRKVQWSEVQGSLVQFGKHELIEKIKNETLITVGLQKASQELKHKYRNLLKDYTITDPLSEPGRPRSTVVDFKDAYVDLAILEAWEMDDCWRHSDLDHHKKANYLKKSPIKSKQIFKKELNKPEKKFVIIRGIAGIGKSMLTDSVTLSWAKEDILTGNGGEPRIDFLFKLKCIDLNEFENLNGVEDVLSKFFPEVFECISLKDLHDVANKVMILIDGIDELKDIHKFDTNKDENCMLGSVQKLLDINSAVLPGHKTLLAGRPEVCGNVFNYFNKKGIVPNFVEICGFNEENVKVYVEKFFSRDNEKKVDKVLKKLEESENLKMMASIPIYLWVICWLFKTEDVKAPQTTTELCVYACLLFIQKHGKIYDEKDQEIDITQLELKDLIRDHPQVLQIIYLLAELSKSTLEERKVVFTEEKIKSFKNIDVSHTGFICKQRSHARYPKYQFKHLVLQEFFTSISLYLKPGLFSSSLEMECFKSCLPMVAGLCGIEKSFELVLDADELSPVQFFLRELKSHFYNNAWFFTKIAFQLSQRRKTKLLTHVEEKLLRQMRSGRKMVLESTCTDNLTAVFEYQGSFSEDFKSKICSSPLEIKDILHHIDIRNMIYFIKKAEVRYISNLHVETIEGRNFSDNSIELFERYYENTGDEVKKALWFEGISTEENTIRITDYEDTKRRGVSIAISSLKNISDNENLIVNILKMVQNVYLSLSLHKLYRPIKELIKEKDFSDKRITVACNEITDERMKAIDVETLEIVIDSNFRFSRKYQTVNLQLEGAAKLEARFDECNGIFSIGLPDEFSDHYIIKESLPLFKEVVLKSSIHTNYPRINEILVAVEFPIDKLIFQDKQNRFEPISMTQFRYQIEAHLHPFSKDRQDVLLIGRAKTETGLSGEIISNEEAGRIFKIRLGNKQGINDVLNCLRQVILSFTTITIDPALIDFHSDIVNTLIEMKYPENRISTTVIS